MSRNGAPAGDVPAESFGPKRLIPSPRPAPPVTRGESKPAERARHGTAAGEAGGGARTAGHARWRRRWIGLHGGARDPLTPHMPQRTLRPGACDPHGVPGAGMRASAGKRVAAGGGPGAPSARPRYGRSAPCGGLATPYGGCAPNLVESRPGAGVCARLRAELFKMCRCVAAPLRASAVRARIRGRECPLVSRPPGSTSAPDSGRGRVQFWVFFAAEFVLPPSSQFRPRTLRRPGLRGWSTDVGTFRACTRVI
jgi:hypothetical protein